MQLSRIRGVRRAARHRLHAAFLLARARAARLRQVLDHCLLASLYLESAHLICTHWYDYSFACTTHGTDNVLYTINIIIMLLLSLLAFSLFMLFFKM